ncbi:hypothetical protein O0I10_008856 [Lichtheimia ornata]|uniref:Uncharacterized protein n=1 Tax=Lichtheimia ornata TaxID=688661 RepID=A0AAD7UYN4_9FUNG|nr:uncharacterized protein O0I10_008856 [Lichtheimia ornata]KAJ8655364.1 hypothetical protein O0I10_008856 [Lichtheimia ornata]
MSFRVTKFISAPYGSRYCLGEQPLLSVDHVSNEQQVTLDIFCSQHALFHHLVILVTKQRSIPLMDMVESTYDIGGSYQQRTATPSIYFGIIKLYPIIWWFWLLATRLMGISQPASLTGGSYRISNKQQGVYRCVASCLFDFYMALVITQCSIPLQNGSQHSSFVWSPLQEGR